MSLAPLSLPLVAMALFAAVAWGSAALLLPAWRRWVVRRPTLARTAPLAATMPWLAGGAVALGALLPGDPHLGQALACHCLDSMPAWVHLCPAHPALAAPLAPLAGVALLLLVPGRLGAANALLRIPVGNGGGVAPRVVDLDRPVALLHGWLRPTLVVDRRLWAGLDAAQRTAVIAHERGHLVRRDPLVLFVLQALLLVGPRGTGRDIARIWLAHAELRADQEAARHTGDPAGVAAALLRSARLAGGARPLGLAWTGGQLAHRVEALLDLRTPPAPARPDAGPRELLLIAGMAGLALLGTPWIHHQVEHLLNLSL